MGIKAVPEGGIASLFGDDFNKKVLERVEKRLKESHPMFKSIKISAKYENRQLHFDFTRNNSAKITSAQREAINEKFGPILKEVIREVQSEFNK